MGDVTKNFSYSEFRVSRDYPQVAAAIELTKLDKLKIFWFCHLILQPVRDDIGLPVVVGSAVRRGELNGLVGGVFNSDHLFNGYSGAVDFKVGDDTQKYAGIIFKFCRKRKFFIKQLIFYYPSAGNFFHLSMVDASFRVWERLYCVSRGNRIYFKSPQEARQYLRGADGG